MRMLSRCISVVLMLSLIGCSTMPMQASYVQITPIRLTYGDGKGLRFVMPWQSYNAKSNTQQQTTQAQTSNEYWTGDGGKGKSLAILVPKATGLEENQGYLPSLVQGELVSNFSGYSAISVLDRQRLDEVYAEQLSGYYNDNAGLDLGHLKETDYIQTGSITRTATGYALQINIIKTDGKMTAASYSGTFTFAELDNLTGIRRASIDLLQKMGVTLTAKAREELTAGAELNHVNAQTALAQGITAQRQGTEVAALSYYFQAAAYDPALLEAVRRSSTLNASISSGKIGDNIRNDIQWRKDWVARLTETEQFFDSFNKRESMPYTLFYTTYIKQVGQTDYKNETVVIGGIETHLHGSGIWTVSIEHALQTIYDGLNATQRKDAWQLASWPQKGVTNLNVFAERRQNFAVVFELLNSQNKVIGRQTLLTGGSWALNWSGRPVVNVNADDRKTVSFQNVNANDITDRMTIRIVTVNGTDAETAARNRVLQIRVSNKDEFNAYDLYKFSKGELQGYKQRPDHNNWHNVKLPNYVWGDPVISIGAEAFKNNHLSEVTIPSSVTYIGKEAFAYNGLTSVIIPNSVTYIGEGAFKQTDQRNSTQEKREIIKITIGANVSMYDNPFGNFYLNSGIDTSFRMAYDKNGRKGGTYTLISRVGGSLFPQECVGLRC
ncbi:leucine-rich repeat domain-containing protein [Treponema sp. R6D11]